MMQAVSAAKLDAYFNKIKDYDRRYGHDCWAILYQADVHMRQEHFPRILRSLKDATSIIAGTSSGVVTTPAAFDPSRPWEAVWTNAVNDFSFWSNQFEQLALMTLKRSASVGQMLTGGHSCRFSPMDTWRKPPSVTLRGKEEGNPAAAGTQRQQRRESLHDQSLGGLDSVMHSKKGNAKALTAGVQLTRLTLTNAHAAYRKITELTPLRSARRLLRRARLT